MATEAASALLGLLLGGNKSQSPAAGLFKWDKRPVNDTGDQIQEGDKIKLKLFVKGESSYNRFGGVESEDPYWHAEQVGCELDDGAYWAKSLAGDKQWDKAEVFIVKKIKNRAANEHGWGLNIMHNGKEQQLANNGHWISTYHQKLYHPISLAAVAEGGPRQEGPYLYGLYFESNVHAELRSNPRLNVKGAGKYCIFMIMRADQPDPNPDEKMSDKLGEEPPQNTTPPQKTSEPQKTTGSQPANQPPATKTSTADKLAGNYTPAVPNESGTDTPSGGNAVPAPLRTLVLTHQR
ncbi:uncharacterized protein KY384_004689 [Bacidia gigantensis]|uniref:uncharacterized protein n=1 Tax=Bacidia gigantensis TaxID=2732470 RepID=UPI001D04B121|nr:uncharacterized protein KY384_004689 [Bacidia gigantensis]KAG8530189.1 hypothetical protein KY384_004689 [Bacidia gigantensis]